MFGSLKNDIKYENLYTCVGDTPDSLVESGLCLALPQNFWQSGSGWSMYAKLLIEEASG